MVFVNNDYLNFMTNQDSRMGQKMGLNIRDGIKSGATWNADKALFAALADRERFLEKYPHYRNVQDEIDQILDKAGPPENRMRVLAFMMEVKLQHLSEQLVKLNRILMNIAA